jgi:hypothetical protein
LLYHRQCLSAPSLRSSLVPPVRVDFAEFREVLGPPPLRIRGRLGFWCQRVDRFQDNLHQAVGLSLDIAVE